MMTAVEAGAWERDDVSDWAVHRVEQVGSTRNLWLEDPETEEKWLHKDTVIPDNGVEQGEDWSEVVSTQVGSLLGVPCAATRLCSRDGRRGSLSLSVLTWGEALNEGTVVMERAGLPDYFPHAEGQPGIAATRPGVKRPGHNLNNIRTALDGVAAPRGFDGPETLTGFDVFAGYMILDALIANRDRHEQNWAVLTPQLLSMPERLAPSYDHASSLGYNLPDPRRQACIKDRTLLAAWAERGTAYRFEYDSKPPSLVAHAANAVAICSEEGADWWRERLAVVDLEPVLDALRERAVSGMSDDAATFARDLLDLNLRRLRDAICQRP
jgi:hypothetical protein